MRTQQDIDAEIKAIRANEAAARAAEAAERAREENAKRERERPELERVALIEAQQQSLAQDLDTPVGAVPEVLRAKSEATTGETRRIYLPMFRLFFANRDPKNPGGPKPDVARESRHVLAAIGQFPPVRIGDKAFATEKEIRALPRPAIDAGSTATDVVAGNYRALVEAFGLVVQREQAPGVESPTQARKRLGPAPINLGAMFGNEQQQTWLETSRATRSVGPKGRQVGDAVQLRKAELALIDERWEVARRERRTEFHHALVAQRLQIVDAIDRALASLPIGECWFWTRQLRRIAASESHVKLTEAIEAFDMPAERIFNLACAGGARFNLSNPPKK